MTEKNLEEIAETPEKKPVIAPAVVAGAVSIQLLNGGIGQTITTYNYVKDYAPQLHEMFGDFGYSILEHGAWPLTAAVCACVLGFGARATYELTRNIISNIKNAKTE
jgi:hypothetical protein